MSRPTWERDYDDERDAEWDERMAEALFELSQQTPLPRLVHDLLQSRLDVDPA